MDEDLREAIERRAYELWLAAGLPEGQALENWLQAGREFGVPPVASRLVPGVVVADEPSGADRGDPTSLNEALTDPLAHADGP